MPCTKCEEGNYKWGETGECKYDTLESCESANSKYNKMQPTPLGKTYEEYAKELKEFNLSKVERVELGIIDDLTDGLNYLQKQDAIIEKQLNTISTEFSSLRKKVDAIKATSQESMKGVKQGESNITNIEKQLKDLGINANSVPVIKKFKAAVSQAQENRKKVQSIPDLPKL